jgi:hypothetical protein
MNFSISTYINKYHGILIEKIEPDIFKYVSESVNSQVLVNYFYGIINIY